MDVRIREEVAEVIGGVPPEIKDVQVDVRDGVVTLRGEIHSMGLLDTVKTAAREVPGVVSVTDHVFVTPELPTENPTLINY